MKTQNVDRKEFLAALRRGGVKEKKRSKYNATRVCIDGRWYMSKREAEVAMDFQLKLKAGIITALEYQPVYVLIPKPNQIKYIGDFLVTYPDGRTEVIDVKGVETAVFKMKAKMFKHFYPHLPLVILE